jgi:hypothetical protein
VRHVRRAIMARASSRSGDSLHDLGVGASIYRSLHQSCPLWASYHLLMLFFMLWQVICSAGRWYQTSAAYQPRLCPLLACQVTRKHWAQDALKLVHLAWS